jgi:hypothetical protein
VSSHGVSDTEVLRMVEPINRQMSARLSPKVSRRVSDSHLPVNNHHSHHHHLLHPESAGWNLNYRLEAHQHQGNVPSHELEDERPVRGFDQRRAVSEQHSSLELSGLIDSSLHPSKHQGGNKEKSADPRQGGLLVTDSSSDDAGPSTDNYAHAHPHPGDAQPLARSRVQPPSSAEDTTGAEDGGAIFLFVCLIKLNFACSFSFVLLFCVVVMCCVSQQLQA